MKFLIPFVVAFNLTAQINSNLDSMDSSDIFSYTYRWTYLDADTNLFLDWNNRNIGLIDLRNGNTKKIIRFYKTGELSLTSINYSVTVKDLDSIYQYCVFGDFRTYYKSGILRSYFTIPFNIEQPGNYIAYNLDEKSKILLKNEYRNYSIYNGIEFGFINDIDFFLYEYKKGKLTHSYSFTKGILYRLIDYDNETYKKVNQNKYRRTINWVKG